MKNHRFEKEDIVYDDALDRSFSKKENEVFRSFRIYKSSDDFLYFEVIWDYYLKLEKETLLFTSYTLNPQLFEN